MRTNRLTPCTLCLEFGTPGLNGGKVSIMFKTAVLFVIAFLLTPAYAAKKVTVEQFEKTLMAHQSKPDAEAARAIAELELTERLSSTAEARMEASFQGEETRHTLEALADASSFLDPPAAEIPSRPAPDMATQKQMLALTVAYVGKAIPQLPNFLATRVTAQFEDTPQIPKRDFSFLTSRFTAWAFRT